MAARARSSFFPVLVLALVMLGAVVVTGCTTAAQPAPVPDGTPAEPGSPSLPVTFTDSRGTQHSFSARAERIICQNGDAAELLIALGAGDRVVGVVRTTEEDPILMQHMTNARSVGDWMSPNIEEILALEPDIVLTYSTPTKNADQLIASNLTLIPVDSYKIPDLNHDAAVLGALTGTSANVSRYTAFNDRYLALVKNRLAKNTSGRSPRVYIEGYGDYSVHGRGSGGDLLLNILNATNIAGEINSSSAKVSPEWIIDRDPDIIIKIAMDPVKYEPLESVREKILHREGFSHIKAVRNGQVYVLNGDVISSPRGIVGVLYVAKALYPEEFSDCDSGLILEEYAREFVSGTDQIQTFCPSF